MTVIKIEGHVSADALARHPDRPAAVDMIKRNVARMLLAKEAGTDAAGMHLLDPTEPLDPRIVWTDPEPFDGELGGIHLTGSLEVAESVEV